MLRFGDGTLSAAVNPDGAELSSLRDAAGREYLWQAGPAWPRHAPLLFPMVGRLAGDTLRHGGATYPLKQHGFARDRRFTLAAHGASGCRLTLRDDAETRAAYPFAFLLALDFAIADGALTMTATVHNPGAEPLPFGFGFHPAFAWPLPGAAGRADHALVFEQPEPAPIGRLPDDRFARAVEPSPVQGRTLPLGDAPFLPGAVVLEAPASRSLRYTAPGARALHLAWQGLPQLGLWTRAGGDFLCIEPWHGYHSPPGWDGAFRDKPGLAQLAPGASQAFTLVIRPE